MEWSDRFGLGIVVGVGITYIVYILSGVNQRNTELLVLGAIIVICLFLALTSNKEVRKKIS